MHGETADVALLALLDQVLARVEFSHLGRARERPNDAVRHRPQAGLDDRGHGRLVAAELVDADRQGAAADAGRLGRRAARYRRASLLVIERHGSTCTLRGQLELRPEPNRQHAVNEIDLPEEGVWVVLVVHVFADTAQDEELALFLVSAEVIKHRHHHPRRAHRSRLAHFQILAVPNGVAERQERFVLKLIGDEGRRALAGGESRIEGPDERVDVEKDVGLADFL